jgi:methionine salvage enolase-phosphatase E1
MFVSDNRAEIAAASGGSMQVVLCTRTGVTAEPSPPDSISSFDELLP